MPEGTPFMLTEFGGITFAPYRDQSWVGYGQATTPEEFVEKYRELVEAALECPSLAGFCYTQLTDTMQERNGLLSEDRCPKVDPATINAITRGPSAADEHTS